MDRDQYITTPQAARILTVSYRTLYTWEEQGKLLPAFKTLGGHRRYDIGEVLALVESLKRGRSAVEMIDVNKGKPI